MFKLLTRMKAVYFILIILSFAATKEVRADTVDYWHVYYNKKLLARFNQTNKNHSISINKSQVKNDDKLYIEYGNDTPCSDCETGLYILNEDKHKVVIATGKGTFNKLSVAINNIL